MPILLENLRYLRVSALPSHDQTRGFLSKFTRALSKVEIFKNDKICRFSTGKKKLRFSKTLT